MRSEQLRTAGHALVLALVACGEDLSAAPGEDLSAPPEGEVRAAAPIVGGEIDRDHRAVGRVGVMRSRRREWFCSGTLIGPKTVLTAAHCLADGSGRGIAPARLRFGAGRVLRRVVRATPAPGYDPDAFEGMDDLAVLVLDRPVDLPPIPVADVEPLAGAVATVVGFGVTRATGPGQGTGAGTRRRARISLDQVGPREIAYATSGGGACYGDSGGPVLQDLGRGEVVVGVTSRGTDERCTAVDIATRADVLNAFIRDASRRDACSGSC